VRCNGESTNARSVKAVVMKHTTGPKQTRKSDRQTPRRVSPYVLDKITYTRSEIERARRPSDTERAA
jgi:hypothetical protein